MTDMKLQKFGIFEVDSLPFVIQTKPYFANEVLGLVESEASNIGANVVRIYESNGIMKFELIIGQKIGFMWVCEQSRHLYFISLPTIDNSPENKQKLSELVDAIGCL